MVSSTLLRFLLGETGIWCAIKYSVLIEFLYSVLHNYTLSVLRKVSGSTQMPRCTLVFMMCTNIHEVVFVVFLQREILKTGITFHVHCDKMGMSFITLFNFKWMLVYPRNS
jgi:hypothetical protein